MRRRLVNRGLAMILSVAMVFGMLPINTYAAEETIPVETETETQQETTETVETEEVKTEETATEDTTSTEQSCSHSWGEYLVTTEATTESEGVKTSTCSSCGATQTESIPKLEAEHVHSYAETTVAATCTEAGKTTYTCECGDSYDVTIESLGHSWGEWNETVAATATTEGEKTRTCSVCSATETEVIPVLEEEASEEETEEESTEEETEEAELSGETRTLYFYNMEGWEKVYAAWSFDEEEFEDVELPGQAMTLIDSANSVWSVNVPVEADTITFSDNDGETAKIAIDADTYYDLFADGDWMNYGELLGNTRETFSTVYTIEVSGDSIGYGDLRDEIHKKINDSAYYVYGYIIYDSNGNKIKKLTQSTANSEGSVDAGQTVEVYTYQQTGTTGTWVQVPVYDYASSGYFFSIVKKEDTQLALKSPNVDNVYEIAYNFYDSDEYAAIADSQHLKEKVFAAVVDTDKSVEGLAAEDIDIKVEITTSFGAKEMASLWNTEDTYMLVSYGKWAEYALVEGGADSTKAVQIVYGDETYDITLKLVEYRNNATVTLKNDDAIVLTLDEAPADWATVLADYVDASVVVDDIVGTSKDETEADAAPAGDLKVSVTSGSFPAEDGTANYVFSVSVKEGSNNLATIEPLTVNATVKNPVYNVKASIVDVDNAVITWDAEADEEGRVAPGTYTVTVKPDKSDVANVAYYIDGLKLEGDYIKLVDESWDGDKTYTAKVNVSSAASKNDEVKISANVVTRELKVKDSIGTAYINTYNETVDSSAFTNRVIDAVVAADGGTLSYTEYTVEFVGEQFESSEEGIDNEFTVTWNATTKAPAVYVTATVKITETRPDAVLVGDAAAETVKLSETPDYAELKESVEKAVSGISIQQTENVDGLNITYTADTKDLNAVIEADPKQGDEFKVTVTVGTNENAYYDNAETVEVEVPVVGVVKPAQINLVNGSNGTLDVDGNKASFEKYTEGKEVALTVTATPADSCYVDVVKFGSVVLNEEQNTVVFTNSSSVVVNDGTGEALSAAQHVYNIFATYQKRVIGLAEGADTSAISLNYAKNPSDERQLIYDQILAFTTAPVGAGETTPEVQYYNGTFRTWANVLTASLLDSALDDHESDFRVLYPENGKYPEVTLAFAGVMITDSRAELTPTVEDRIEIVDSAEYVEITEDLDAYIKGLITAEYATESYTMSESTLGTPSISEGELPDLGGETETVKYLVKFAGDTTYKPADIYVTIKVYKPADDCLVVGQDLDEIATLAVSDSTSTEDGYKVAGLDEITIGLTPVDGMAIESVSITGSDGKNVEITKALSYSNRVASVTFKTDGSEGTVTYTVTAEVSAVSMNLKSGQTIEYCVDNADDEKTNLKQLIFDTVYNSEDANPEITVNDVTIEYKYYDGLLGSYWGDVTKDLSFNIDGLTHKFGEDGSETIRVTLTNSTKANKYGSLQKEVELVVYDSCYNNTITVVTEVPTGVTASVETKITPDAKSYSGATLYKQDTSTTVTATPNGEILDVLEKIYNGTYSEKSVYIESITVKDQKDADVAATLTRGQASIFDGGVYNAAATFTTGTKMDYTVTVRYGVLEMAANTAKEVVLNMYQGNDNGDGTIDAEAGEYAAEVPSAEEIFYAVIGDCSDDFLEQYSSKMKVEFSTDIADYTWTEVSDTALLDLENDTTITVRVTWKDNSEAYKYYPVSIKKDVTLRDLRTATTITGTVPEEEVEYVEETQLIDNLKAVMNFQILDENENVVDGEYAVLPEIKGNETDGYYADVTVTYAGSDQYKPATVVFKNVPIKDIPDNATFTVTGDNMSEEVRNISGTVLTAVEGVYTVIGNSTYNFVLDPEDGYAIESVTYIQNLISDTAVAVEDEGTKVDLDYNKQIVSFEMQLDEKYNYVFTVTTVPSEFTLEENPVYDLKFGYENPVNEKIADAAIAGPEDIDMSNVKVEYLARTEGTAEIQIPEIVVMEGILSIPAFSIPVDLGELWLDPTEEIHEVDMEEVTDVLVVELVEKLSSGELTSVADVQAYVTDYVKSLTLNARAFGSNGDDSIETIRLSYEDDKYLIGETVVDITINDPRIATTLEANDCEVSYGYSLAQLLEAAGASVVADEAAVSGIAISGKTGLHAKDEAQEVTLEFAGDADYQPCETTINVTVNKAECSIDYDSQYLTYGEDYEFALSISPETMPDGTASDIQYLEFMIGLDMANLLDVDIEDKTVGLDQAITYIQVRLPESIRNLPVIGEYLEGEMSLGQFVELMNSTNDLIGIDDESMSIFNDVIEAITGVTDNMDIKVIVTGEDIHPTNIGVYIAGAVTVDSDFETAYTADYLIIAPKTIECTLEWDYQDDNNIMTLPAYQETFKDLMGAHVVENVETGMTGDTLKTANENIKYLILAVNDETSEFLTTDIEGNIKANVYVGLDEITDNGAYAQIAYMMNWGNEIYYAAPIVRTFVIAPQTVEVQLVGATGEPNNDLHKIYNGQQQGFSVEVTDMAGNMVYSDHYQNIVALPEGAEMTYKYVGLQTNTNPYNSSEKPEHAGAYLVVATYVQKDAEGNILAVGMDTGVLVIEPSESTITVEDKVHVFDHSAVDLESLITEVDSVNSDKKPDVTVISAAIAATGDFSENGFSAIDGNLNIDFPKWLDEMLADTEAFQNGVDASYLLEFLNAYADDIEALIAGLDLTEEQAAEAAEQMSSIFTELTAVLEQVPENVTLTFNNDATATSVGVYMVTGIVTDSDHYPSTDSGILVIVPATTEVELKFNEDLNGNNIFTPEQLKYVDLNAQAYDKETGEVHEEANKLVTNLFVGVDVDGNAVSTTDASTLNNGVYTQYAFIIDVGGEMYYAEPISRVIILAGNPAKVEFVDESGAENNDRVFTFDNTGKEMKVRVTVNGTVVTPDEGDLVVTYTGVQTNTHTYNSTEAPTHAGAYVVTAKYTDYDENGKLISFGAAVGAMVIEPADSTIEVTGGTVTYDGEEHAAEIVAGSKTCDVTTDVTIITGTANVDADIDTLGIQAITGNVNIDFPKWLDKILAENEFFNEGITPAYLKDLLSSYIDDVTALIPEEELVAIGITQEGIDAFKADMLSVYNETITVLEKMPQDISLTFNDDVKFTEPGAYLYYGIVTDSDHKPSADTGLLIIEKMDMEFGAWHTVVPYDGKEHSVVVPNDVVSVPGAPTVDYITMVVDRANNHVNIITDADLDYVWTAVERILNIDLPEEIDIATLREMLAETGYTVEDFAEVAIKVIDAVLADMDIPTDPGEYARSTAHDLVRIKEVLTNLPETGIITFNGALPSAVGEYEFYILGYSEYYKSQDASARLFIEPIRVIVDDEANSKVYGTADPELKATVKYVSYQGVEDPHTFNDYVGVDGYYVGGEYSKYSTADDTTYDRIVYKEVVITALPDDIGLTYDVVRAEGENVGFYDMWVENAALGIDSDNYVLEVVEDDTQFEITKATLIVYADDATKVYGDPDPKFTFTSEGLVNGDTLTDADVELTRAMAGDPAGENVGDYAITPNVVGENILKNYDVDFMEECEGTLTITPAKLTVVVNDAEKTYGEVDPDFKATVTGLKFEDDTADFTFSREKAGTEEGENVGTYTIYAEACGGNNSHNYEIESITTGTLKIEPAELTVKVESAVKYYGESDDEIIYTYTVEGEKFEDDYDGQITFVRAEGTEDYKDAGTYEDALVAVDNFDNYTVVTENGDLTIKPAEVKITVDPDQTKVYGAADPEKLTGKVEIVDGNGVYQNDLDVAYERAEGENVGEYLITATPDAGNTNYKVVEIDDTNKFTITPATLTVKVTKAEKFYGQTDAEAEFEYEVNVDDLKNNDAEPVVIFTRENDAEDVGFYPIVIGLKDNDNYDVVADTTGVDELEIKKATVTIKIAAATMGPDINAETNPIPVIVPEITQNGNVTAEELNLGEVAWTTPDVSSNNPLYYERGEYEVDEETLTYDDPDGEDGSVDNWDVIVDAGKLTVNVGDYVCWHVEEGVYYYDLSDALDDVDDAASETIEMLKDYEEQYVIIAPGTTLDLADRTVTATFVVGFEDSYLIGDPNVAKLYVNTNNIELAEESYINSKGYSILPIYVPTDNYFTFSYFQVDTSKKGRGLVVDEEEKEIYFQFMVNASTFALNYLKDGALDNKLTIGVRLEWTTETGIAYQDFVYLDATVAEIYTNGKLDFYFKLTGFDELGIENGSSISIKGYAMADSGVVAYGKQLPQ